MDRNWPECLMDTNLEILSYSYVRQCNNNKKYYKQNVFFAFFYCLVQTFTFDTGYVFNCMIFNNIKQKVLFPLLGRRLDAKTLRVRKTARDWKKGISNCLTAELRCRVVIMTY